MRECDLIMKGGVTSGVVYPPAIVKIADEYRLRSIGGTSAGAIAAVIAAAAEYRRRAAGEMAGFHKIEDIGQTLGTDLDALFQPSPEMEKPFQLLKRFLKAPPKHKDEDKKKIKDKDKNKDKDGDEDKDGEAPTDKTPTDKTPTDKTPTDKTPTDKTPTDKKTDKEPPKPNRVLILLKALALTYRWQFLSSAVLCGACAILAAVMRDWGFVLFFLLLFPVLAGALVAIPLWRAVTVHLPKADFGLCSGKTQPGHTKDAFSDWIAKQIEDVGRGTTDHKVPLTIGDLKPYGIEVATMTTDLTSQRPYRLPLLEEGLYVSKAEMERLFPEYVVKHLCANRKVKRHPSEPDDLCHLPVGDAFPLVLMARMSLSFPILISGVPIWRVNYNAPKEADGSRPVVRLLFSDGGISSNFPIHFFDAPLPTRPTFGIKLGPYPDDGTEVERVHLPDTPNEVTRLQTQPITGITAFIMAIFNTAKDWSDTLQSELPGYAERIVEIRLKPSEGGLNFTMPKQTVEDIQGYGEEAGDTLVDAFTKDDAARFQKGCYARALSYAVAMEDALAQLHTGFTTEIEGVSYLALMTDVDHGTYDKFSKSSRETVLAPLYEELSASGEGVKARKRISDLGGPNQDATLRLSANAHRKPARAGSAPGASGAGT